MTLSPSCKVKIGLRSPPELSYNHYTKLWLYFFFAEADNAESSKHHSMGIADSWVHRKLPNTVTVWKPILTCKRQLYYFPFITVLQTKENTALSHQHLCADVNTPSRKAVRSHTSNI